MSNSTESRNHTAGQGTPLARWVKHHEQQLHLSIKGRVRGQSFHLLCESNDVTVEEAPSQRSVHQYFQANVDSAELSQSLGTGTSRIRHIWLYGRVKNAKQPAWKISMPLPLIHSASGASSFSSDPPSSSLQSAASGSALARISQHDDIYSLAEQGDPQAIAHYLHHVLMGLGLNARIRIKLQTDRPNTSKDRLWITCRGTYSPAAAFVGEPVARQLRSLSLANVEDALLKFQVTGEDTPAWVLRIDLTPQEEMLREWARWGDVEAISRLVNQRLRSHQSQLLEASLKDITLHLSCAAEKTPTPTEAVSLTEAEPSAATVEQPDHSASEADTLDSQAISDSITQLLAELAPQGIHGAVVYGQHQNNETPAWVEWLDLPAKSQLDRSVSPLELANNGDDAAIAFLLRRLLNPDLNVQLATGGIRVQVLAKQQMLYVMCDAPSCPAKDDIAAQVEKLLRSLELPGFVGIRLYGRRAGQHKPRWHHPIDLVPLTPMVPEPAPQFAATDAYVTELVTPSSEPALRPDLTPTDLWNRWRRWRQQLVGGMRRSLLSTRLVVPTKDSPELAVRSTPKNATVKTAIVWSAVGVLALIQADLGLGQLTRWMENRATEQYESDQGLAIAPPTTREPVIFDDPADTSTGMPLDAASDSAAKFPSFLDGFSESSPEETATAGEDQPIGVIHSADGVNDEVFDNSGFIVEAEESAPVSPLSLQDNESVWMMHSAATAQIAETLAESPYPSFNSDQLDYKLALYYQRLLEVGPPDVLILGSSRALRGVDPIKLEQELADLGYPDADVFNFGVNGATAQVVELIVQHILLPEQLPKLIVWADGARAFNSGRDDRTFNGIVASEGYEQLLDGSLELPSVVATVNRTPLATGLGSTGLDNDKPETINTLARSLSKSYAELDDRLSDLLATISTSYNERDRLKMAVKQGLTLLLPSPPTGATSVELAETRQPLDNPENVFDGTSEALSPNSPDVDVLIGLEGDRATLTYFDSPASLSAIDNIDPNGF
ncbi:MAG: hypothetical protein AB4042_20310, partial [Leptolyngbyaceae cyanobacterium]